jgi:hypothetical protein
MELQMFFVDWHEAIALARDGALENGLADALELGAGWLEDAGFPIDSHILYITAVEAWEAIRGAEDVPVDIDRNAREFMDHLITHDDFAMDLPNEIPDVLIAISPETATRLSKIVAELDFSVYRDAYLTRCDSLTKNDFAQCAEDGTVDAGFEEGFLQYIAEWVTVVRAAADSGRGLLVELS